MIAQGVSAILCFIYMAKKYPNLRFDSNARALSLPIIKKLINIAVPMLFNIRLQLLVLLSYKVPLIH